ncbi:amidohydrolase domain containing protein [Acanthamoeba castellanii str. Neff]|uniref:Amidohydrolase domain containing protein n=1 Tax=Acanthamoeba castellanii (strain ATCC 30010 / Neff) TaxID=1257118 RepID=L8HGR3_ACACF|nr:amidohydrolase domain containing protein [Acanthamoeba castellanii str. Neff]ELR24360.1 amidohydrolase domain containing protein [Acanthamoeba castellanii str. Neff]
MSNWFGSYDEIGGSGSVSPVPWWKRPRVWAVVAVAVAVLAVIAGAAGLGSFLGSSDDDGPSSPFLGCPPSRLQYSPFYAGAHNSPQLLAELSTPKKAERQRTFIANGTVWTMSSSTRDPLVPTPTAGDVSRHPNTSVGVDVIVENGVIHQIGRNLDRAGATLIIDAQGRHVTPGLVDMHSHLGVYSFPEDAHATQDGNEMTGPTLPQLRALDALDPEDPAIPLILGGGVTTALVLPGSANVMGGEAAYVKLKSSKNVHDMLIPGAPRALKMACGENPKRVYGGQGRIPSSRMGIGLVLRQKLIQAAQLRQSQEQWDCMSEAQRAVTPRPFDLDLEPLVALLRGDINLNVHCYETQDIATMMEGYDGSVHGPRVLHEAGVNVVLKSDHPVIFGRWLMYEAARAHYYGLDAWTAIASVTRNPANSIGLGHRVGTIEDGKDGDLVIWDRHPLQVDAQAFKVLIEGHLAADNSAFASAVVPPPPAGNATLQPTGPSACQNVSSSSYAITDVTVYTMDAANRVIAGGNVVVQDGVVQCVGTAAECPVPAGGAVDVYSLPGGQVMPGLVNVGTSLALYEVDSESGSADGAIFPSFSQHVRAADGVRLNMYHKKHLRAAWAGGVTTLITPPWGPGLVLGLSAAFSTTPAAVTIDDALIGTNGGSAALHLSLGDATKGGGDTSSISGQVSQLRAIFASAQQANVNSTDPFARALRGELVVVIAATQADDMASAVRLKQEFGFDLVILGGVEAELIAAQLASANVSVVLNPARSPPNTFSTWHAMRKTAAYLNSQGVRVGLAVSDPGNVRNLRWEAGASLTDEVTPAFDKVAAIASVTTNIARMFRLEAGVGSITANGPANLVAFTGEPLSFAGRIALVAAGSLVECSPDQF